MNKNIDPITIDPKTMSLISHELRGPMAVIRGYISLLNSGAYGELSDKAKETLEQLDLNAIREIYLVHDFGFFLKLHQGEQLQENAETMNLLEKVQSIVNLYSKEESKAGKAEFNVGGNAHLEINTRPWIFSTAISFLLKYAVRGAEAGVKIEVTVEEKDGKPMVTVKDNDKQLETTEDLFKSPQFGVVNRSGIELFNAAIAVGHLEGFEIGVLPEYQDGNDFYIRAA